MWREETSKRVQVVQKCKGLHIFWLWSSHRSGIQTSCWITMEWNCGCYWALQLEVIFQSTSIAYNWININFVNIYDDFELIHAWVGEWSELMQINSLWLEVVISLFILCSTLSALYVKTQLFAKYYLVKEILLWHQQNPF